MVGKIELFTSLPPAVTRRLAGTEIGQAYLVQCVKSWRRADFEVISLNSVDEIQALSRLDFDVGLRQIAGNRPTIADFLGEIRASGAPTAAIINADVFLSNNPELLNAVVARSADGMTMLERINIDPASLQPTGRSCYGFDSFIFRTEPLARIDLDFEFLFGQPWWDYWFPLAYVAAGGKLMKVKDPFLFHLDHSQNWNQAQWIANGQKTVRHFLRSTGELPDEFADEIAKFAESSDLSEEKLGPFSHWCYAKLRAMAEPIQSSRQPDGDASLPALIGLLDDPDSRSLVGELNEAHARIAAAKEAAAAWSRDWGAIVGCNSLGDSPAADDQPATVRSEEVSDLHQHMSLLLGRPISSSGDALQAISAAIQVLNSRKAVLARFVGLNFAWIKGKYLGPR